MSAPLKPLDDIGELRAAAWIWIAYLAALTGIDWLIYAGAPNPTIAWYYLVLGGPALALLGLVYWPWPAPPSRWLWSVSISVISLGPVLLSHWFDLRLPLAPLANLEGMSLRQMPVLLIGLILVAWHYPVPVMLGYSVSLSLFELWLVAQLGLLDNPLLTSFYFLTLIRTVSFGIVGLFINRLILRLRASQRQLADYAGRLEQLAVTDPLTGVFNRRQFFARAGEMLARTAPAPGGLAVVMVDIDHFKGINDRYGHAAGDAVLCEVARRLRANLRVTDVLARYGGEEFVVLLPRTDQAQACHLAERLREAVATPLVPPVETPVTISLGAAVGETPAATLEQLLAGADEALYQAKAAGRNCWRLAA